MVYDSYDEDPIFREALAAVRAERDAGRARSDSIRRSLIRVVDVALIGAIAFSLFVAYGLVNNRWYRIIAVEGESMRPTLVSGDAIVLTRPPEALEPGMVVTLEVDGHIVTHRIVTVGESGITTRGDANAVDDDWQDVDVEVVGVQRARIPLLGRVLTFFAGITGSNAWQSNRAVVGGSVDGIDCEADCVAEGWTSERTDAPEDSTNDTLATTGVESPPVGGSTGNDGDAGDHGEAPADDGQPGAEPDNPHEDPGEEGAAAPIGEAEPPPADQP